MALPRLAKSGGIAISGMVAAAIAAHFIMGFEGQSNKAYRDGGGMWTICKGHTQGVYEGEVATDKQCAAWYVQDVSNAQAVYDHYVHTNNPPNTEAAAISFIFNTGEKDFRYSTLLKKLNAGDVVGACNEFPKWKFMAHKNCEIKTNQCYGLVIRRKKERELCLDQSTYSSYGLSSDGAFIGVRSTPPGNQSHSGTAN